MNIQIKPADLITIVLRLYVAMIVGMFILNAAFRDEDDEEEEATKQNG